MKKLILLSLILLTPVISIAQSGIASYYGEQHQGRLTASGKPFNMNALTAAHRTLPFGTKIRVKNLDNNKFVIVVINDRGPFIRNRVLDLSQSAAIKLDMIKSGTAKVNIKII